MAKICYPMHRDGIATLKKDKARWENGLSESKMYAAKHSKLSTKKPDFSHELASLNADLHQHTQHLKGRRLSAAIRKICLKNAKQWLGG